MRQSKGQLTRKGSQPPQWRWCFVFGVGTVAVLMVRVESVCVPREVLGIRVPADVIKRLDALSASTGRPFLGALRAGKRWSSTSMPWGGLMELTLRLKKRTAVRSRHALLVPRLRSSTSIPQPRRKQTPSPSRLLGALPSRDCVRQWPPQGSKRPQRSSVPGNGGSVKRGATRHGWREVT